MVSAPSAIAVPEIIWRRVGTFGSAVKLVLALVFGFTDPPSLFVRYFAGKSTAQEATSQIL
jgi:hypothetical protein